MAPYQLRDVLLLLCTVAVSLGARAETSLERGTYLGTTIVACGNCHTAPGAPPDKALAGGFVIRDAAFTAVTSNITPDRETGIGGWSDAEIIRAIRDGKRPDGSTIGPPMPFAMYRGLSDDDAQALVAWLRSVKPVRNSVAKSVFSFALPPAYGPPVGFVSAVSRADAVAYGGYLATALGHCLECHSTPTPTGADLVDGLGAGGRSFKGPWGESVAANLTPTGLSLFSDGDIKTMISKGLRPDGSAMSPPMGYAYYAGLSTSDLDAIVAYLRTLPPK